MPAARTAISAVRRVLPLLAVVAVLCAPGAAHGAPGMYIGAVEDAAKQLDLVGAKAKMDLARLAGFGAVRITAIWEPGQTQPRPGDLAMLENAVTAASLNGIRVIVAVYHRGSRTTPLTGRRRAEFAFYTGQLARKLPAVRDFIVGNEPNLNRFWMPQFTRRGASASPAAYLKLLAQTYDALKRVSPEINVIGVAVSPRGGDNPRSPRHTHSPTRFILELGKAYRRSRRARPIMDTFAIHPYLESSRLPPTVRHPRTTTITIADYGKLVRLLGRAFNGTRQRGSGLPILYGEFGVQSQIPRGKRTAYRNLAVRSGRDAVSEARQAAYYRQALALAYCQRTVVGFLFFHVSDEDDLDRWQSGVFYADDTPKTSFPPVRRAVTDARMRRLARC